MIKFSDINQKTEEHMKILKEFYHNPVGFLLLCGKNGIGKSFVAEAICCEKSYYEIKTHQHLPPLKGHDRDAAWMINQHDLNAKFVECCGSTTELSYYLKNCKILALDDLGTKPPTDTFLDFLFGIIDYRSHHENVKNLGTIITTNLNGKEMREKFGERIASRVSCGKIIKMEGEGYHDRRLDRF